MPHEVYGPYRNFEEAVSSVEVLGLKGYRSSDINVIAKDDLAAQLQDRVDATIIGTLRQEDDKPTEHLYETLRSLDMSDRQAKNLQERIKTDEIVIVIDKDQHRMGNDYIHDTDFLSTEITQ